jgi:hypothetical protein
MGHQNFSVKAQRVSVLVFVSYMASVATAQPAIIVWNQS